jgi:hypothetical protein
MDDALERASHRFVEPLDRAVREAGRHLGQQPFESELLSEPRLRLLALADDCGQQHQGDRGRAHHDEELQGERLGRLGTLGEGFEQP